MHPAVSVRALGLVGLLLGAFGAIGCSDTANYETRQIKRPLGMAVTCADAGGVPVGLDGCDGEGVRRTGWVLDGDEAGLVILDLDTGRHFDADPFLPGYNALPVGGVPLTLRGSADSRFVYVLLGRDDELGGASLLRLDTGELDPRMEGVRQALACDVRDFALGRAAFPGQPDGVPVALVLAVCPEGSVIWALDIESFGDLDIGGAAVPKWVVPGEALRLGLSVEGTTAYVASTLALDAGAGALPQGDLLTRIDLLAPDGAADSRRTVALGSPGRMAIDALGEPGGGLCLESPAPARRPTRVRGAPAVSPGDAFVYLPLGEPAGIAVFHGNLDRIDVNAPLDGVAGSGNRLLAHLGSWDIPLDSPAIAVAFVEPESGVRAVASTENGDLVRIVVTPDEANPVPHVLEAAEDQTGSVASSPDTRFGGEWIASAYLTRPDLASFGSAEIVLLSDADDLYRYYGIEFQGDTRLVLSETWTATYEGILPGTRRCGTLTFGDQGEVQLVDPTADFCALGVVAGVHAREGDVVVLRPELPVACGTLRGGVLEYRVAAVRPDRLVLAPAFVSMPLPEPGCLEGPVSFEIRVEDGWTVVGSRTGFLHAQVADGDACVVPEDADPLWNGRAYAPVPRDPSGRVTACPIREGDPQFSVEAWDEALFQNPVMKFRVVPGCRVGQGFLPEVAPAVRDTQLMFRTISGFAPLDVSLSGLPGAGLAVAGTRVFGTDAANGLVFEVDVEEMTLISTRY